MNGYLKSGIYDEVATFDLFFRQNKLITYSLAAGLEQVVDYLQNLNFGEEEIEYLRSLNLFDEGFLKYISSLKFTGDVYAVPEGTVVFPGEPILTIRAPIIQAQLVETALLLYFNRASLIATKTSRIVNAAKGMAINCTLHKNKGRL